MLRSVLIATLMLVNVSAFSEEFNPELMIKNVVVTPIENSDKAVFELPVAPANPIDEISMYVDGLIALGKKIWPIIEAGRPVINTTGLAPSISVIPHIPGTPAQAEFYAMADWSAPKSASYRVSFKNYFNSEVIGFTYTVYFQYNGSYLGAGKYITSLRVQASEVYAQWGFDFSATSQLVNMANVGSANAPVASAILEIAYTAKGLLNESRSAQSFYVDGSGVMKPLN
ncbi:MAG: hypothetical protein K2Q18_19135 [Bdellovibrionales bacterium]|nr:hypothetical protein [Bdellovibrionales bacterium]